MRSAIFGVYFADDAQRRKAFVVASAEITHCDPRASIAAQAIAEAAAALLLEEPDVESILSTLAALTVEELGGE